MSFGGLADYSGGPATDLHRLPFLVRAGTARNLSHAINVRAACVGVQSRRLVRMRLEMKNIDMAFFDYHLPPHLIAQEPLAERDQSRLLHLDRVGGARRHRIFRDLPELLRPGDLLVLNDTRVLPARLLGRRERTGGKWEGLFLGERPEGRWEMLCQTRRPPKVGDFIRVESGSLRLELVENLGDGRWLARPEPAGSAVELLARHGRMPLPHYIRRGLDHPADALRYQTVYAAQPGAIAAPTAGLHFTPELFDRVAQRGVSTAYVTLHVGPGTFQPIRAVDYRDHVMHAEWGELSAAAAQAIAECRQRGGRVIAVGTTSVRVLESVAAAGSIRPWRGMIDLYIYPPYRFRCVDALITNFHLPRSTLLLLASAFAGEDRLRDAYAEAVALEYRFYSYGDAMFIE